MPKKNYLIPFIVFLVLAIILGAVVFSQSLNKTASVIQDAKVCEECPEKKAEVLGMLNYWGENIYDSSEYLFNVYIYNFGQVEAKNVEVICEVYVGDEEGYTVSEIPVTSISKRIGNVASTSFKIAELKAEKNYQKEGEFPISICKVNSCDNCELLLDRIPD